MKELPQNVKAYKQTAYFNEKTVLLGLLKDHSLAKNIWGKIVVLEGVLKYVIQSDPLKEITLNVVQYGVVEPEVLHHVKVIGPVKFYVEFYKADHL